MTIFAILRGGGRHGAVVYEQIPNKQQYKEIFVWDDGASVHPILSSLKRFDIAELNNETSSASTEEIPEVHCFVAVGSGKIRQKLVESVREVFSNTTATTATTKYNLVFPTIIHKTAVVSETAIIGEGCFIGPFALVNTSATIRDFCIINSAALVEHDCVLESFVTLNPGAILCGTVTVQSLSTLGAQSCVRDDCYVETNAIVGMNAAVVRDIRGPLRGFWGGVPAKPVYQSYDGKDSQNIIRWCYKKNCSFERLERYLQPSLEQGHLTNDGPLQPVVIAKVKSFLRCKHDVIMACNGTAALHALIAGLSLKIGKPLRWVTQAFTFPSSIQGPLSDSFICDIDPVLYGPSMSYLNQAKDDFDGVIVTNCFGFQTGITVYEKWCKDNGKLLVFDNAASPIGFLEDGRSIQDIGDGAIVSFHETKPCGRGEGGAVIASPEVIPFVHQAMNFGYDIPKKIRVPNRTCSNWRMSDMAAAAICDHLDAMESEHWEQRLEQLTRYSVEKLGAIGKSLAIDVRYPTILSCLFVKLDNPNGEIVCQRLQTHGIEAKHYYSPLVSKEEAPETWKLYECSVCLPFHLQISQADMSRMIDFLERTCKSL